VAKGILLQRYVITPGKTGVFLAGLLEYVHSVVKEKKKLAPLHF
jgi:hypothetical protein